MGRLYLVRHGETQWNSENTYAGVTDVPLNETGREQAKRAALFLAGRSISAVYCSDLCRASETAQIIAVQLGLCIRVARELREVDYGEWEGLTREQIEERDGILFAAWQKDAMSIRIPGGETFAELRHRALPRFLRIAEEHQDGNVVVVAHKCVNRVILCSLLGVDVNRYRQLGQDNACINVILRRPDGSFVVEKINERCHLRAQPARPAEEAPKCTFQEQ